MTVPRADLRKAHKAYYTATAEPALIEVPDASFLMIDGTGDPDGPGYRVTVEALYGVAYAVRAALKRAGILESPVPPLQGRWWTDGDLRDYAADRDAWRWILMIMQPAQAGPGLVAEAVAAVRKKKPDVPADRVRLETLREGVCAQILHVGPYRDEAPTIDRLHAFIEESGHAIAGRHHEIYLSDPRRTAPEKLKTIIRYPVVPAA